MIEWHGKDLLNRMYVNLDGGKKAAMPRYYKDKLYSHEERILVANHQQAIIQQKQMEAEKRMTYQDIKNREQAIFAAYRKHKMKADSQDKL